MIVNQALTVSANGSRPVRSNNDDSPAVQSQESAVAASGQDAADTVSVNTQRLIVSENLNASEAVIPDQASAGNLMSMLKKQLEFNPADAMDAQASNLGASAARLLSD